ncbi:retropepsin-like aspartic protease [Sphingomonas sp. 1P06PA]|uniref:retropepsin-like aspartic protease family protein n=1 Tax=Sphingomonas sp. 1P06PA TaxID=554121 RepID=UPI0039A61585
MDADLLLMPIIGTIATLAGSLALAFGPLADDAVAGPTALTALTQLAAPGSASASGDATVYNRAADGMFYVDAMVNHRPVRFLVDTGATHIVLSPRDAKRVAAEPDHRRRAARLRTAGGSAPMHWAMLGHVGIGDRTEQSVRAVVASDQAAVPVSLMGQNMLSRLSSLTIEGDRLTLR